MNAFLLAVTAVAAVNPPRTRMGIPEAGGGSARMPELLLGTVVGLGTAVALAAASGPLLEALEVTPETFRIAAGLVLAIAGLRSLAWTRPADEPELPGRRAALWPIAVPRVLTPEVTALAVTTGSIEGVGPTAASLALAGALLIGLGALRRRSLADGVLRWAGALLAVLLVMAAAFVMIDGIRDV